MYRHGGVYGTSKVAYSSLGEVYNSSGYMGHQEQSILQEQCILSEEGIWII